MFPKTEWSIFDQLADSIRPDTRLVSIMTANNETGVIQPMREISRICRERGVLLHSDMVQAFGKTDVDVSLVDAGSFAAHKFYGPKGTGFPFLRSGLPIQPTHVRWRARKSAAPRDRKRRRHRGNGCGRRVDIARRRDGAGNGKRNCVMISGHASQSFSQTRSKMATSSIGSPTRSTQVSSALIRKRCLWRWIWKAFARRAVRPAWLAR